VPDAALHVVELGMPSGTWYSLWQPGWTDAQDDSGPFLARSGELYVFRSPAELVDWCAAPSDSDHDLVASPAWAWVGGLPAVVHADDSFDLTWSAVPVEGEIPREAVSGLRRSAVVLDDLLVAVELEIDDEPDDAADSSADPDLLALCRAPELVDLLYDPERLDGALSGRRRHALADLIRAHGPAVVRLVERRLSRPEPRNRSGGPPGADVVGAVTTSSTAVPLEQVAAVETVWVGLFDSGFYTMRQIVDPGDAPAYLGTAGELLGAAELVDLRRWLSSRTAID